MFGKRACLCGLLVCSAILAVACDQAQRRDEPVATKQGSTRSQPGEARFGPAWEQLRERMDPVEVLQLLGEPTAITVNKVNTYWYYSARAGDGPHVVFGTRQMKVERWRSPGS